MNIHRISSLFAILLIVLVSAHHAHAYSSLYCTSESQCGERLVYCPAECPNSESNDPLDKVCRIDCDSPKCKARKTSKHWDSFEAGCYDQSFVGGDGHSDFVSHGKRNLYFALISDSNLQINARFSAHHPAGRTSDEIEALGILFDSHTFSLEATKSTNWDDSEVIDSLRFSNNGIDISVLTSWESPEESIKVERSSREKNVIVTITDVLEILVNVVSVTNKVDSKAYLEVRFRLFGVSDKVEGMVGRIYQPDFEILAKIGVAMSVVGREEKYNTSSLLSADCGKCVFSPTNIGERQVIVQYKKLECFSSRLSSGSGIVCRKSGVLWPMMAY